MSRSFVAMIALFSAATMAVAKMATNAEPALASSLSPPSPEPITLASVPHIKLSILIEARKADTKFLNLEGYKLTFDEEFNTRSISQNGDNTRWADIRPEWRFDAHSDIGFGTSSFLDPSSGYDPFEVENGALTIAAQPDKTPYGHPGSWESGLIHTRGEFSQQEGYFEIRADWSGAGGAWDAFWLLPDRPTKNPGPNKSWQELDIVEHYGNNDQGIYTHIHTTHSPPAGYADWSYYYQRASIPGERYNTFGIKWTADKLELYFNGEHVGSKSTPADYDMPMFILANLAIEQDGSDVNGPTPQTKIDYIRVFSNKPDAVAVKQDTVSAPDGKDPGLYGATTASGPSTPAPPSALAVPSSPTLQTVNGSDLTRDIVKNVSTNCIIRRIPEPAQPPLQHRSSCQRSKRE